MYNDNGQKVLAKVHFRIYPSLVSKRIVSLLLDMFMQDDIPNEMIKKVKYGVNRESPEDKVRDFIKWMKAAKNEVVHLVTTTI